MRLGRCAGWSMAAGLVIAAGLVGPPALAGQTEAAGSTGPALIRWSPALRSGQAAGVVVLNGRARLTVRSAAPGAARAGTLTLPVEQLAVATDDISTLLDARVPAGATASVDIRGRGASGTWSPWISAGPARHVQLPETTTQVQSRLVLSGGPSPVVAALTLTARPAVEPDAHRAPLRASVFATREGLVGSTTANGHVIVSNDFFVALPSRRGLSPQGSSTFAVRICAPTRRCVYAPVWDVGPWNTQDDYWNPGSQRQQWGDLHQGTPEAQAAFRTGYNRGLDQYGRHVANPAGIDLGDGVYNALHLTGNTTVTVDYLWTGTGRKVQVAATDTVDAADVIGPAGPATPVGPTSPTGPATPAGPTGPAAPVGPISPTTPAGPTTTPASTTNPASATTPAGPTRPASATTPANSAGPTGRADSAGSADGAAVADVLSAPQAGAPVIGAAAAGVAVPVTCLVGPAKTGFVQVGVGQYLAVAALPGLGPMPACTPSGAVVLDGVAPPSGAAVTPAADGSTAGISSTPASPATPATPASTVARIGPVAPTTRPGAPG